MRASLLFRHACILAVLTALALPVSAGPFGKKYSTSWLFASPRVFLYSHLSEKDDLQYYAPVLTKEQFVKEPYVEPDFFDFGFAFKDPMPDYTTVISGPAEYQLSIAGSGKAVAAKLFPLHGGDNIPHSIWIDRSRDTIKMNLDVPDRNEYRVCIYAYNIDETKWPTSFGIDEFEYDILSRLKGFFFERKITETERGLFIHSYYKVQENNCYYFFEDQFDTERNNAVDKILRLLRMETDRIKPILCFNLVSNALYPGYGKGIAKYPEAFPSYAEFSSTRLISPLAGLLKTGGKIRFEIDSDDFTAMAIVDGVSEDSAIALGNIVLMTRDTKTKYFVLEYLVPTASDRILIYGIKDGQVDLKNFWGQNNHKSLWMYTVER